MPSHHDEFLKRLLATFRVEAEEHLQAISSSLFELDKKPADARSQEIVELVFREAHSLKGAARAVDMSQIESICQAMESVLARLKGGQLALSAPLLDLLHQTVDTLGSVLAASSGAAEIRSPEIDKLVRQLGGALSGHFFESTAPSETPGFEPVAQTQSDGPRSPAADSDIHLSTPPSQDVFSETIRVSVAKLDGVMRQTEELLSPRLAASHRSQELRAAARILATLRTERKRIQPLIRQVETFCTTERLANDRGGQAVQKLLDYLEAEQHGLKTLYDRLGVLNKSAEHDVRILTGMTDNLLSDVKEMQLLPFRSLLETLPRLVRELARDQGKSVELILAGGEIEVDRRILERMKDPLIHLLRNSIDHGIESPSVREACGKPRQGAIRIAISQHDSGKIEIQVSDDGGGIDPDRVKMAIGKLGLVSPEQVAQLGDMDVQALVFQSGVSTSQMVTDVSGRGLGLAIVREKVEQLGGVVALSSTPDVCTEFRIILPLTLANFQGVIVRAGGQLFIIPAINVDHAIRIDRQAIKTVENRETVSFDGQVRALVWLSDVLALPRKPPVGESADMLAVMVLVLGTQYIAFCVEEVVGEQDVLVKPLGPQLGRVRNIAGACVLGTGAVVPVLNIADLLKSAVNPVSAPIAAIVGQPADREKRSILVVEDSITSRSLLQNILETAGYRVTTAVDGMDAFTTLKTGQFDLIVSDVEMPRMDGFDLTSKVRADKQFATLPVVLVTALGTREHRERGIDVGANAYIVKSSFEQSNLLDVISRFL